MKKRIMLVLPSTTYRTHAFMTAAAKLDIDLVVASDHRQALGALVPDTTLALNFRKLETIADRVYEFGQKKPIDAVVGVDDASAYIAALAARALGIPHNPVEAAEAARNKYLMRQKMEAAGLNNPSYQLLPVKKKASRLAGKVNYPAVLKPLFLSASRGVTRVNDAAEFAAAFQELKALLALPEVSGRAYGEEAAQILAEDYIEGVEIALEGILVKREFKALAIFDKPDPLEGPHFVETIYVTPSRLPGYVQREAVHAAHRAALALGLENGPVHAELRINERGAWVIEIAARSIGGLCSQTLRFLPEMSLEELILRQAVGENILEVQRERAAAAVMMLPVPQAGILEAVEGVEAAKAVEGVEDVILSIPAGQEVLPLPRGGRYLGFIFARAEQPEDAETAIREAYRRLKVVIRP